jgi:hypothetical protein
MSVHVSLSLALVRSLAHTLSRLFVAVSVALLDTLSHYTTSYVPPPQPLMASRCLTGDGLFYPWSRTMVSIKRAILCVGTCTALAALTHVLPPQACAGNRLSPVQNHPLHYDATLPDADGLRTDGVTGQLGRSICWVLPIELINTLLLCRVKPGCSAWDGRTPVLHVLVFFSFYLMHILSGGSEVRL